MSLVACVLGMLFVLLGSSPAMASNEVDFVRDVQPILAQKCYECHGSSSRKGGLRLTNAADAFRPGDFGVPVISRGDAELSPLMDLLVADDPEDRMPQKGDPLSAAEIDTIRQWINQGAPWPAEADAQAAHWAYRAPQRPSLPDGTSPLNGPDIIDGFVRERLTLEGLAPADRARPESLVRRLHFDLIGLPPDPATVQAFLEDPSDQAWVALVDRLLASPQFGEHWATQWLDLARYADSTGFMAERMLSNWPYRDWVVDAMNRDLPFDQFSIEQLAGDLLEVPTVAQRIATGFHRAAPLNLEGGVREEEARVLQVLDNVNTASTAWLASTVACAQCHDHKFDPISQKEYFQLYSFFNGVRAGVRTKDGDDGVVLMPGGPRVLVPGRGSEAAFDQVWREFQGGFDQLSFPEASRFTRLPGLDGKLESLKLAGVRQQFWNQMLVVSAKAAFEGMVRRSGEGWFDTWLSTAGPRIEAMDNSWVDLTVVGERVRPASGESDPELKSCVLLEGTPETISERRVELQFPAGRWSVVRMEIHPPLNRRSSLLLAEAVLEDPEDPGRSLVPDRSFVSRTVASGVAGDLPAALIDGDLLTHLKVGAGRSAIGRSLNLNLAAPQETAEGDVLALDLHFRILVPRSGHKVCFRANDPPPDLRVLTDARLETLRTGAWDKLSEDAQGRLEAQVAVALHPEIDAILATGERRMAGVPRGARALVVKEVETPRVTRIFERGDPHVLGEPVEAGTPASLHPFPPDEPRTRLGFARWLVAAENPLTARVAVNRWWGQIFGAPIVTTPEDFGIRGARPTHPELLDWLATDLVASNWSRKDMIRKMVLSDTYRQSLQPADPEVLLRDPDNRLLARSSHRRLSAEAIRDNALKVSGLLVETMGGPAVYPPQPRDVWVPNGVFFSPYVPSVGSDMYRRGLYTVWRRSAPPPNAMSFGASERTACRMTRSKMNTPLQALVLLNDDVFSEAALAFAERILDQAPGESDAERLEFSFMAALSRAPEPAEREVLLAFLERRRLQLASAPDEVESVLAQPRHQRRQDLEAAELASWFGVARVLLNLDEVIHRG